MLWTTIIYKYRCFSYNLINYLSVSERAQWVTVLAAKPRSWVQSPGPEKRERCHKLSCVSHIPIATLPTSTHTQINVILKGRILFKIFFKIKHSTLTPWAQGELQLPCLPCPLHTYSFLILSHPLSLRAPSQPHQKDFAKPPDYIPTFSCLCCSYLQQKQICHWGAALATPSWDPGWLTAIHPSPWLMRAQIPPLLSLTTKRSDSKPHLPLKVHDCP